MMEVELLRRISAVAQVNVSAFREVKLNWWAVVDDRVGSLAPADPERRLPGRGSGRVMSMETAGRLRAPLNPLRRATHFSGLSLPRSSMAL